MCKDLTSGFISDTYKCGCDSNLADNTLKTNTQAKKTEKDTIDEAKKYSNTEVPTYNKIFGITLLIVTAMVLNGGK